MCFIMGLFWFFLTLSMLDLLFLDQVLFLNLLKNRDASSGRLFVCKLVILCTVVVTEFPYSNMMATVAIDAVKNRCINYSGLGLDQPIVNERKH